MEVVVVERVEEITETDFDFPNFSNLLHDSRAFLLFVFAFYDCREKLKQLLFPSLHSFSYENFFSSLPVHVAAVVEVITELALV